MKLVIITNLYPPFVRGGAEYIAAALAGEAARQGHIVKVITSVPLAALRSFGTDYRPEGDIGVYRFFPLNIYHYLKGAHQPYYRRLIWQIINLFNWFGAFRVKKILRAVKPDAVISFNLMGLSLLLPRLVASLGIKQLHTLHDVQLLHPSGLFYSAAVKDNLAVKIFQLATRFLFSPVKVVLSPSRWLLREHLLRGFFKKSLTQVLSNPVPPLKAGIVVKSADKFNLIYSGQLQEHKGIFWLIKVLQTSPRYDFVLNIVPVGTKEKLAYLRALIASDSRFVLSDSCSQSELESYIAQSHLAIIPSLCQENSPTIITMAQALGTPVLAARSGGIPELVREGETGWLFTPGDSIDFIHQLNWCLDNQDAVKAASAKCQLSSTYMSLSDYAREIERQINRII